MSDKPEWIESFLQGRRYAVLATQNDDGSIHLTPVWYLFEGGEFFVVTCSTSRKARNVLARPTASLVVDERKLGSECWVSASGSAELVRGEVFRTAHDKILRRYLTGEALAHPTIGPGMSAADDVMIRLKPAQWRSWDLKSIDAQYFGGHLAETPWKWYRPLD